MDFFVGVKASSHLASTFTLTFFENNRSNGNKTQMQIMGSVPIFCINVSVTIDAMLKFDANADVNVSFDASVNGPLQIVTYSLSATVFLVLVGTLK